MEIYLTTGARCLPQFGPFAVPEGVWTKRWPTASVGALRPRGGHRVFFRALHNMIGSDLSGTDRMRTSAPEP